MATPVITKTHLLFDRTEQTISDRIDSYAMEIWDSPKIISVKIDGSSIAIIKINDRYRICRRYNIYKNITNIHRLTWALPVVQIGGYPCLSCVIERECAFKTYAVKFYCFDIDQILNESGDIKENLKYVFGFVELDPVYPEDKNMLDFMNDNKIYLATPDPLTFEEPDLVVRTLSLDEIMKGSELKTFELISSKICRAYGLKPNKACLYEHGSLLYPNDYEFTWTVEFFEKWFDRENDRWANVEGIVIFFPEQNVRFKIHRGYLSTHDTAWGKKRISGVKIKWPKS